RSVRESVFSEPRTHLGASAKLVYELRVEPRLVDAQMLIDHESISVKALDIVSLVGGPVAPYIDFVIPHGPHEPCAGDGSPQWCGIEVRLAGGRDMERTTLQRHQSLADEVLAAVNEPGDLRAIPSGSAGEGRDVRFVRLTEVSGVRARNSTLRP